MKKLLELSKKNNEKGFTLIELIIVVAILGILLLIAIPRLAGFQEKSRQRADEQAAASLANAAAMFLAEQDGSVTSVELSDLDGSVAGSETLVDAADYASPKFPSSRKYANTTVPPTITVDPVDGAVTVTLSSTDGDDFSVTK